MRNGARMSRQHLQGNRLRPLYIFGEIPYYYALFPWKQTLKLTTTELDITGVPGSGAIVVESKETVPWQRASSVPAVGPKVSRMFPPIILSRCVSKNIVSVAIPEAFNLEYIPVPHMRRWDRYGLIDQIYACGESDLSRLARSIDTAA